MKRMIAALFVLSVFTASPVQAKDTAPAWVAVKWSEGKRCRQWEALMRKHKLPVKVFSYICFRESGTNPKAWNKADPHGGSFGLWQINGSWTSLTAQLCGSKWGDMKVLWNPECNARVTAYLYREDGLAPWGF